MITDAPPVEENWTPPSSRRELDQPLRARAGAKIGLLDSPGAKPAPTGASRRPVRPGTARSHRLEAAGALQRVCPAARRCSAAQVAALIRVFLAAGWTTGDLVYALDHGPDGVQRLVHGERGILGEGCRDCYRPVRRRSQSSTVARVDASAGPRRRCSRRCAMDRRYSGMANDGRSRPPPATRMWWANPRSRVVIGTTMTSPTGQA